MEILRTEEAELPTKIPKIITQKITTVSGLTSEKCYECLNYLGRGSFSTCYLFKSLETSKQFAIKIVEKATALAKSRARQKVTNPDKAIFFVMQVWYQLNNEIYLHKRLKHSNIVEFVDCFQDESNVYILLELCPKKTLSQYLKARKRLRVAEVQSILRGLCAGLKYLHSQQVIHRDLKLANIFLSSTYAVKIGDFGLSTKLAFDHDRKRSLCGTPNYLAPEVILGQGYSYEVDIWSVGVIVYTLFYGAPPFQTDSIDGTYQRIVSNSYTLISEPQVPFEARKLIKGLLETDPSKRTTLDEILESDFMYLNAPVGSSGPQRLFKTTEPNAARSSQGKRNSREYVLNTVSNYRQLQKKQSGFLFRNPVGESQNSEIFRLCITRCEELERGVVYQMSNCSIGYIDLQGEFSVIRVGIKRNKFEYYLVSKTEHPGQKDGIRKLQMMDLIDKYCDVEKCIKAFALKGRENLAPVSLPVSRGIHYVKKFRRHMNMFMFRLSDQTVHWKFEDDVYISVDNKHQIIASKRGRGVFEGKLEEFLKKDLPDFNAKKPYVQCIFSRQKTV